MMMIMSLMMDRARKLEMMKKKAQVTQRLMITASITTGITAANKITNGSRRFPRSKSKNCTRNQETASTTRKTE